MSAENERGPKPASEGDSKPKPDEGSNTVPERKITQIYYCHMCKVPCMSAMTLQTHYAGIKHKKRERALQERRKNTPAIPVLYEEPLSVKKPLSKNIKCLRDYMKDPEREEPLIGIEYVVEIRFKGKREPCYECQLCMFQTEMAPMLEHLTGQKHRKAYLNKHYPDKAKRNQHDGKEDRARFLKRIAREIENTEGLKMYKREICDRECTSSMTAQMKAVKFGAGYKPKNDPVRRGKAWEYLENFQITSDEEATRIVRLAQTLSEALKTFCDKQATLKYIKSLQPLMPFGKKNARLNKPPDKAPESYNNNNPEVSQWNSKPQPSGFARWSSRRMSSKRLSSGLAQLKTLLQHGQSIPSTPADSYVPPVGGNLATVSAPESSFSVNPGFTYGGGEQMLQFEQPLPESFLPPPCEEQPVLFTPPPSSYILQQPEDTSMHIPGNTSVNQWEGSWQSMRETACLDTLSYPSHEIPFSLHNGLEISNSPKPYFNLEKDDAVWPQQPYYQQTNPEGDLESHSSLSGSISRSDYQPQNIELNNTVGGYDSDFAASLSALRGKDAATLASMLQQLVPHYPDLQKIDIHALAQALSEMS